MKVSGSMQTHEDTGAYGSKPHQEQVVILSAISHNSHGAIAADRLMRSSCRVPQPRRSIL